MKKQLNYMVLIVLSVFFLIPCYGLAQQSGARPSSSDPQIIPIISSYSINGVSGMIDIQNQIVSLKLPNGTALTNLVAKFQTSPSNAVVLVNSTYQTSGITPNNFTKSLSYKLTTPSGAFSNWTVNVVTAGPFVGYYPTGCTLSNANSTPPVVGTCECIRDSASGDIWYTDGSKVGKWTDWCAHSGAGADPNCPSNGSSLVEFNSESHCGLTGGWSLPTMTNPGHGGLISNVYNPGGEWGNLATVALDNGYVTGSDLSVWMNDNGFNNVQSNQFYWSSQSHGPDGAWVVYLYGGLVYYGPQDDGHFGVLLVRVGQ